MYCCVLSNEDSNIDISYLPEILCIDGCYLLKINTQTLSILHYFLMQNMVILVAVNILFHETF